MVWFEPATPTPIAGVSDFVTEGIIVTNFAVLTSVTVMAGVVDWPTVRA